MTETLNSIPDLLNKIHLGDCMDIMRTMPDKSVDLVLTDPPYMMTKCEWDKKGVFDPILFINEAMRITKDNAPLVMTTMQPFTTDCINAGRKWFKQELIWDKVQLSNFALAKHRFCNIHENILIFCKNKYNYYPKKTLKNLKKIRDRTGYTNNRMSSAINIVKIYGKESPDKFPVSIFQAGMHQKELSAHNRIHTTQKPLSLWNWLIQNLTQKGDIVIDPFSGSGTTAVACHNAGLDFIAIEKDPEYHRLSCERLDLAKKQLRLMI